MTDKLASILARQWARATDRANGPDCLYWHSRREREAAYQALVRRLWLMYGCSGASLYAFGAAAAGR